MRYYKRIIILICIALFLGQGFVMANSMEPPGMVIIIEGRHETLDVWLTNDDRRISGNQKKWPFETQYWFYHNEGYDSKSTLLLHVKNELYERVYELEDVDQYHTTYSVKIDSNVLVEGKSFTRSVSLVGMRVLLTLLIEGLLFYIMGFRKKRSWIVFLLVNLVTQMGLNLYINTSEVAVSYAIIYLIWGEFWVFLIEGISLPILVKEKKWYKVLMVVMVANTLSLFIGGYLLTWLPI